MTKEEIENFPKSADEYWYYQKDKGFSYKAEIERLFEVIKYKNKQIKKLENQRNTFKDTVQTQNKYIEELEDFKKRENYKRASMLKYAKMHKEKHDKYELNDTEKYNNVYQNAIDNINTWR